jgi:hypothetical protein
MEEQPEKKPTKHWKQDRKDERLEVRLRKSSKETIERKASERGISVADMFEFDYCDITPETIGANDEGKQILIAMRKMAMLVDKFAQEGLTEELRDFMKAATKLLNDHKK